MWEPQHARNYEDVSRAEVDIRCEIPDPLLILNKLNLRKNDA